ncbi:MAG: hypothetical protein CV088_01440 [Nitrospira sp. LK70]|nr:hypothetical protein [Nitrospira sp. LK70]
MPRLDFSITPRHRVQLDDETQTVDGLTVATSIVSALRMNGIAMDYGLPGTRWLHIPSQRRSERSSTRSHQRELISL